MTHTTDRCAIERQPKDFCAVIDAADSKDCKCPTADGFTGSLIW